MSKRVSKVVSIATALPKYKYEQNKLAHWMHKWYNKNDERLKRILKVLYHKSNIDYRYSVLPDFSSNGISPFLFCDSNKEPKVEERMEIYHEQAMSLALSSANKTLAQGTFPKNEITHLITVSCTGMSAPGIEIQLKEELKLDSKVACYTVNFVGCYAVFPALKMADAFCKADDKAKVLIVAVELCTIHFQNKTTEDHLLSNALFADGAASCIVCSHKSNRDSGFLIRNFAQKLLSQGSKDMAWNIHSEGFLMQLTSYVPHLLDEGIPNLLEDLFDKESTSRSKIKHWAIHPGGRKILEQCEKGLHLQPDDLACSYDVLRQYGNLSAPTILFVLKELLEKKNVKQEELCFALGFGPGLTMEAALLEFDGYV